MHKIELKDSQTSTKPSSASTVNKEVKEETSSTSQKAVDESFVTDNNDNPMTSRFSKLAISLGVVAVVAGIATGYGGFKLKNKSGTLFPSPSSLQRVAEEGQIKIGDIFGVQDEKTFKDSAEGYLEIGGIDGEGSHSLLRQGGVSQTVYLTSSITDLDKFEGMEVKIWGETFKGQKAGWLMDVGRIEIINPDGENPSEE